MPKLKHYMRAAHILGILTIISLLTFSVAALLAKLFTLHPALLAIALAILIFATAMMMRRYEELMQACEKKKCSEENPVA